MQRQDKGKFHDKITKQTVKLTTQQSVPFCVNIRMSIALLEQAIGLFSGLFGNIAMDVCAGAEALGHHAGL